ncbi:Bacterioferritin [hydrothermal vent metagenome]|uniref:Bacterioferritin n=1 Tax=hydrothermal vent metagenome TaxID=652676 RepID=A0A3B1E0R9_9ZZZZ
MQGNQNVIECLNTGLTIELTAINQYFIHSKMCRDWGFNKLADYFYKESIEEMQHADAIIDRILYLEGVPAIARYDVVKVGQTVEEQLTNNLSLEYSAVATYNDAVLVAVEAKDVGSKELMERMVVESEESVDWGETQLELIKQVGIQNYLAAQMGAPVAE